MPYIVLFDGICNLCSKSVQFIIRWDKNCHFKFASIQSEYGKRFIEQNKDALVGVDSIIYIRGESIFTKSTAVIWIFIDLRGIWIIFGILFIIPKFIRDLLYNLISKNRYKVFGKREQCLLPDDKINSRFLN